MKLSSDSFNRLSLGIIEQYSCSPEQAMLKLTALSLNLVGTDALKSSLPLQAALLTAVNTGKRAFLGGVSVIIPENIPSLVNWPGKKSLNEIIVELGGNIVRAPVPEHFTLTFGKPGLIDNNCMQVICNNWQAGVLVNGENLPFDCSGEIPTAGIFAGAWSVFLAFLKMSRIDIASCDRTDGISLWRPDFPWLDNKAKGPSIELLPSKYWLLGLGHLGQAYLWNIGLLPYNNPAAVSLLLQDYDKIVDANWSAGLLSEKYHRNVQKTRVCSRWLEMRGFTTAITERKFDAGTKRTDDEPYLALCGFDSGFSRLHLDQAGFDLVVESGLGSSLGTFDIIAFHTFPGNSKTPQELWGEVDPAQQDFNETVYKILRKESDEVCGIIPLTISGKSMSASFIGACSAALCIAETLRGLHGGMRYDKINLQLRDIGSRNAISMGPFKLEMSKNGFVFIHKPASIC